MSERNYSVLDGFINRIDEHLGAFISQPQQTLRGYPAENVDHSMLSETERRQSEGFMRVNHAGEVSAQALYKAQALTARDDQVREAMERSAEEEIDHLVWCEERLHELGGRTSLLGPFWFFGSFTIGSLAGLVGDKWNLGFVVETENQVVKHLDEHLNDISTSDLRSRAVLEQMREDEAHHASVALHAGAANLPESVKKMMRLLSKVMTKTAYWI
jgi:ubiquinone biosynthesis monooxygenase Coq7